MADVDPKRGEPEICSYCGLPIDEGQAATTVNGKRMHVAYYQEMSGGTLTS